MDPVQVVLIVIVLLYSAILHECAHGLVALRFGDTTALAKGRLTLNPIAHIDPFFTILLPIVTYMTAGFAFGGAKPVPINVLKLRNPSRDFALSCLAGPMTNVGLLLVGALLLGLIGRMDFSILVADADTRFPRITLPGMFFWHVIMINFGLAVFNMLPIPPLDGSRVVRHFLPERAQRVMDRIELGGIGVVFVLIWLFGAALSRIYIFFFQYVAIGLAWLMGSENFNVYFDAIRIARRE